MPKELEKDLKALAKKHGLEIQFNCCYCRERQFSDGGDENWMVTFSGKAEDED